MNKNSTKTKKNNRKRRVVEAELPNENIRRPANGDWSTWERRARRQMAAAARAMGARR